MDNEIATIQDGAPPEEVIRAFGFSGKPTLISGGQNTCYRIDRVVFKPTEDIHEAAFIADIYYAAESDRFRVPTPFRAQNGLWVYNNWTANEFLDGEHRPGAYHEVVELCKIFHRVIKNIQKPEWFDKRENVFAIADKMAWGELPLPVFEPTNAKLQSIKEKLKPNRLPYQLIHGDWGPGQILFHNELTPAIIDMTPYFRPADYPIADTLLSAIVNHDFDLSILDLGQGIKDFDQLILRAFLFRISTYINFQIHPENERNWLPTINKYLELADAIGLKAKDFS
jgi:uncharacterized protein (TIGR02569 family)